MSFPRKSAVFPGVTQNEDGSIDFSLTDDEDGAITRALALFQDVMVHPEAAERIQKGTMAVALSHYAKDLVRENIGVSRSEFQSKWPDIKSNLEKSIAAVWKAYSLYPLPILLYHRASFMEMLGLHDEAHGLFRKFREAQDRLEMDQINMALMGFERTNIQAALLHAA